MADDGLKVTIEGKTHDLEDFELGEIAWGEEQIGMALDDALPMTQALAFVAIIKRRENPDFSIEDAKKLKLSVFDEPPAADPPSNGAKKRPTRAAKAASTPGDSGVTS